MNKSFSENISYFYELSMSLGQSFTLSEICESFSKALLRDDNMLCVSVWLYDNYLQQNASPTAFSLAYSSCNNCFDDENCHSSYLSLFLEKNQKYKFIEHNNNNSNILCPCPEKGSNVKTICLLALDNIGAIKLFYKVKENKCIAHIDNEYTLRAVRQFTISIKKSFEYNFILSKASQSELLLAAVNQSADILIVIKTNGVVEYVNESFVKAYGYDQETTIGQPLGRFITDTSLLRTYMKILRAVAKGDSWQGMVENKVKSGKLKTFDISVAPVYSNGEIIRYVMSQRDVTQTVELENYMRQSQKMESLGTLAGGIAHDFNNILFSIMGNLELAMDNLNDENSLKHSLADAYTASSQAEALVKQILAFSRKQKIEKQTILLSKAIKDAVKMIKASVPSNITVDATIAKDGYIMADPSQFNQVIVNLCTNAYKAIKNNGSIIVQTRDINRDDIKKYRDLKLKSSDDILVLEIIDNGQGIPKDIIDKIFDPFFTTREVGKGTGLGLSMAHGVIDRLGGKIYVESEVNIGTVFSIYIPIAHNPTLVSTDKINTDKYITSKKDYKLMIVDDEVIVASLYKRGLEKLGFKVECFDNPFEALKCFSANSDEFDLVVADMMMPKMTGNLLADELRKVNSKIPIIICSGYSNDTELDEELAKNNYKFVEKPVPIKQLATIIDDLLNQHSEES